MTTRGANQMREVTHDVFRQLQPFYSVYMLSTAKTRSAATLVLAALKT